MSVLADRIADLSPEKQALLLQHLRKGDQGLKPAHIQRRSATDWLPLSFAQQRLWFLDQLEPNSVVYNIPVALRLTGSLNMLALQRSLNEVVHRHEVLRTTFVTIGEQVRQVIAPVLCLDVPLLNLQILPKVDREREAMRLATEEAQRPFDLAHGPLLRIRLLRLGDEDHALLLVFHHIIADGWSLGVLVRELTALYTAFAAGRPSPLPELPIQYADFACWQREWLQGKVLEKQLAYWQRQLGDELPILDLPTDRPRPAAQTYRGARLTFTLAPALSRAIVSLSQREGVTLFMTLLAAFQVLLYRYSGQTDLTVGTPIANRNRAEIEPLIGFFANTLVLRTDLSNEPNFHELLRRAREVALDAYANQDVPFEVLVDRLRPDRSLDRSPLFQAMFALQKPLLPLLQLASLNISQMEVQPGTAKFDLLLEMDEAPDTFRGVFEYNTDLFDASTIQRMSGHFQTLLTGLVVDPNRPIDTVPLLTGTERRLLLTEWTSTESDYPREARLHQRVELQATRTPDAIAVIYEGRSLTYHELNSQANQLAHYLRRHEVGPGAVVALYLERSPEMVVAMLGVLKAGGAYLPLDLTYPAGRLAFMLQDSNVSVVLTQAALLSSLPAGDITPICLDTGWDIIAQESETNPTGGATPDHLAYALYTSGSTGIPKGVMISHRAICNHMFWMQQAFPLTPADRVLQKTPVSFDASVWEFYAPLWAGAVLVLARQDGHRDSAYLVEAIRGHRITILQLVPTLLRMLLQEPGFSQCRTLRRIFCGGEALTADLQERLYATLPVELHNLYGPTEASIDATFWSCRMSDRQPIVPIGRPIANMQAYVLDHILQPLPVGVPGELYIGGVGLARGYLHRPELTAERFLPNPYGGKANEKLYRTGDRVRWRADGTLEFLGRSDHQVKVRGFRIELGEVEMSLSRHPDVREVAVVVREDIPGDKQLVAYLVPAHAGQTPPVSELRGFLKARLPDYMVPSAFVTLEALPLTPNGKLDRRALPAPDEIAAPGEAYVPPHTPTEELLAGIWSQVLHRVKVSVTVNFFEMGGHSLLATQVISRVREICQVELPLRALFEAPTIASLAAMVEQARQGTRCLAAPPIQRIHHSDSQPLSFAQQRLWFLDQLEPGSPLYNIAAAVRLSGALDSMALEQSINEVISRHDVLRTTFEATDGRPTQRIASKLAISLPMVDISALAKLEQEAKVQTLAVEEARRPFTLTLGPLLRARILRLSHQEHIMLFVMHHAIADGWSMSVLIREVATLYRAIKTGQPAYLPELRVQYADFAQWQRTWLQGETLEHQLGYWKQQLAGSLPLLELPIDRPRPLVQTSHGAMHPVEFPQALADQLVTLSHREGVTLFMTLLAALKVLLHRYARATDICVGTPIANRTRAEIEDLIGCFVNTLVLRTDLSGNPSFRELLRRVRETALGAYAHQDIPFEMVVDTLQPERNLTHTPLFQVMFVLQNAPTPEMALPGLCLTSLPIDTATATFDLTLTLQETSAGLSGAWEYNTDLFDAATIAQLTSHLRVLLDGVLLNPDQPIDDLPLLAEHERQQLLVEWNATSTGDPREACIHQLFEAQAARTPAALAVIDPARSMSMTYAELDQRTNQLAHYLQRMGVGPETLVGLFAERSVEMLVGILGVLKAGGAYVPLDPQYPGERLSFMLEDSRARLLLTQQALLDRLPARDTHVVCLDDDWPAIAQEPARTIGGMANADQLAYVIYTSGSTGQPKGVCVTHRSVVNHNRAVARAFGLQAADRVLQFASMSFDAAVEEIFPTLACGACLVLRSAGVAPGSDELIQLIQSTRITVLDLPTAYWQTWVSSLKLTGATWPDSVRLVVVGGEAASSEAYATWRALAGPGVRWLNTYGPTEATVISTLYEAHGQAQTDMSIGRPIANTRLYLLDEYRRPVPVGMPGELYLGGVAVARGYLNQPHLTAERFIPDPFGPQIELGNQTVPAFLYKTGDLARYRRDGNVVFLGRTDDQVKIRGFRVELGEIETALSRHPGIRDVAVIPHETQTGKQLVAYIVSTGNQTDALVLAAFTDELRAHLKARLPEYMLPSAFVLLDALPLTPSGKLDRHTLPTPDVQAEYRDTYLPPRTPVERTLAGIWARVLGLQQVGVRDNFFALGGDSILSIQVIARANQAGLWLTARQLFEHPTVEGLAAIAVLTPPATKHCEQGIVQGLVPLTPIQHWFFDQDLPEPQHWNQSVLLEAQTPLSRSPLEAAFAQLVIHHDALRLRCSGTEPGFLQISAETDSGKVLEWVDLSTLSEYEQALAVQAKTTQAQASLSLYEGPLLRAIYFNLGPGRSDRLFVTIHHLAVDGVSWRILLEDLQTAYEQLQRGESVSLPPKTTSFRYWAHRLAEHAQTETLRQEQGYWLRSIDAPDGHLPSIEGAEGRANTEATARSVSVSLSSEETRAILQDIPAVYGTEINDILLTAMVWAFAQSTGSQVLLVDLEGHGREDILDDVDLSRTVGWFTTMFPVWLDIRNATTLRTALMAIKEQLRQIPQHGIGYGLLRYLRNEQDIGKRLLAQPRAEVSFNYLGQFDQALAKSVLFQYAREPVGPSRNLTGQRGHLLEVNGAIIERQLRVEWTYSEALHQRTAIEEVASDFVEALRLLIVHCESPEAGGYTPSDFPDAELSQSEIDALLAETSTA